MTDFMIFAFPLVKYIQVELYIFKLLIPTTITKIYANNKLTTDVDVNK